MSPLSSWWMTMLGERTLIRLHVAVGIIFFIAAPARLNCQTPAAANAEPDVLIFVDGEKLIGHLESSTDKCVTFKSAMAGEITADWSKIKEIHSAQKFAVIEKGTRVRLHENTANIPQGTLSVTDQSIQVGTAAQPSPVTIPVSNTAEVIDETTFLNTVLQRPSFFRAWRGTATLGISFVNSTQNSQAYTSAVSLTRSIPNADWMDPSNRTILTFNSAYGKITQPGTPTVKTSIIHGEAERDQYFSPRVYVFGDGAFDHNYSQGLNLQQTYGGGVGWTALKRANDEIDLKAELDFVDQQFLTPAQNQTFLGSIFSEAYNRTFPHKIVFHEQIGFAPAWTSMSDYSATGNMNLSIPAFKRLSVTLSALDTFLNNPAPGFRKNSFQFTTGLTYTLPK